MIPNISVIIPVLHEAHIINHTLAHLYNQNFTGDFEILVVDSFVTIPLIVDFHHFPEFVIPTRSHKSNIGQVSQCGSSG